MINQKEVKLSPCQLDNLLSCFSNTEVSCSDKVLQMVCHNFQCMERDDVDLQVLADIIGSTRMAQYKVNSPVIIKFVIDLTIFKSRGCKGSFIRFRSY